jgi:hypothetical protein
MVALQTAKQPSSGGCDPDLEDPGFASTSGKLSSELLERLEVFLQCETIALYSWCLFKVHLPRNLGTCGLLNPKLVQRS